MAVAIKNVLRIVAEDFGVSVADIKSARRSRQVVPARLVAAYLAHTACGMTHHEIGSGLGGRDHTTIVMYCRAMQRRVQEDEEFRRVVQELAARILGPGDC